MSLADSEREKYERIWQVPEYHAFSPGKMYAPVFNEIVKEPVDVVDLGCGAGEGGLALREIGHKVTFLDLFNANDLEPFVESPLWGKPGYIGLPLNKFEWGFCCDVMEHIPTEMVGLSLNNIAFSCRACFFSIGLTPDHFGQFIGEPLHLTVRPFTWWRDFLKEFGEVEDARDLWHTGVYVVRF